jgi:membrane protein implicated in regulation of membrane protease activity
MEEISYQYLFFSIFFIILVAFHWQYMRKTENKQTLGHEENRKQANSWT